MMSKLYKSQLFRKGIQPNVLHYIISIQQMFNAHDSKSSIRSVGFIYLLYVVNHIRLASNSLYTYFIYLYIYFNILHISYKNG